MRQGCIISLIPELMHQQHHRRRQQEDQLLSEPNGNTVQPNGNTVQPSSTAQPNTNKLAVLDGCLSSKRTRPLAVRSVLWGVIICSALGSWRQPRGWMAVVLLVAVVDGSGWMAVVLLVAVVDGSGWMAVGTRGQDCVWEERNRSKFMCPFTSTRNCTPPHTHQPPLSTAATPTTPVPTDQ